MAAKAVGVDPYLAAEAGENARAALNAIRNAAKTKQPKNRAGFIREAQNELRSISATQHPKLVNALQAKLLALQGRGGDTALAHVEPGEMIIPRSMLTPEVLHLIATEAQRRGIDPRRLMVGGQGSINPATGAEEFRFFDTVRSWFGGNSNELDMTGIDQPLKTERRYESVIEPITVSARRRIENVGPSGTANSWITEGGLDLENARNEPPRLKVPTWISARVPGSASAAIPENKNTLKVGSWVRDRVPELYFPSNADRPLSSGGFKSNRDGGARPHNAYDFPVKWGEDVYSAASGTVSAIGNVYDPATFAVGGPKPDPYKEKVASMYKYVE